MRREDGSGEGGRVEGDAGTSFGGSAAQCKKGRGRWDSGSARTVFEPVKEMLSESIERCVDGKREPALVLASELLQYKEGWEEGQAKGRQYAKQMVVE